MLYTAPTVLRTEGVRFPRYYRGGHVDNFSLWKRQTTDRSTRESIVESSDERAVAHRSTFLFYEVSAVGPLDTRGANNNTRDGWNFTEPWRILRHVDSIEGRLS